MNFRKLISLWALLALMLGQIALAEHSVSHIDHGLFQGEALSHEGHSDHKHDNGDKKHECPECLLTKSLQTAFYSAPFAITFILGAQTLTAQHQSFVAADKGYQANLPRAPPVFFI